MTVYEVFIDSDVCRIEYYPALEDAREARKGIIEDEELAEDDVNIETLTIENEDDLCALLTELANG